MSLRKIARSILIFVVPMLLVGCGTNSTPSPSPSTPPVTAAARFALVANSSSNSISTDAGDPRTGQLTPKDTVPTGGMNSRMIAMDWTDKSDRMGLSSQ
jgi:hypothetical protein